MEKKDNVKYNLFKKVRSVIGGGVRSVLIKDEALCDLLDVCIEDYAERVQNWAVENQWSNLFGKKISETDVAFALSVRTMDMMKDYSYWFSKEVGLQQRGPWELKKDFITIEMGKQDYIIPAGREINKVLWMTPPTTQAALFANYAGLDIGFGGGYAQLGGNTSYAGPMAGYYIMPAYDTMQLAADMNLKNRLLRSDLIYTVTAGPNGTRILHLLSTPGSKFTFSYAGNAAGQGLGVVGCQVWYTYYDLSSADEDTIEECRMQNNDILITPDQVPLNKMDFNYFNEPTKVIIRQLLIARAKKTEGLIRGFASGKVPIPVAEMVLDYQMLLEQGKDEEEKVFQKLDERLDRMRPENILEKQASITKNTLEIQKGIPMGIYVI